MINLALEKPIYYEIGTKVLTESQLRSLADGITSSGGVSVSSGETLSVVCDLGARYNLIQIYYYRARATSDVITIYGRQSINDVWTELPASSISSTSHFVQLSSLDRYRQVRIVHTVSSGSATAREIEVYTDDTDVLFGSQEQGVVSEYSIDSGTSELVPLAVYVRNPDNVAHDFYVLIDSNDADGYDYKLSYSKDGPYYAIYEKGTKLPRDFSWSSGQLINTSISGDTVRITAGVSGTYYTPVLDLNGIEGRRFFWQQTISGTNEIDIDGRVDSAATVHIRMSNTSPSSPWVNGQLSNDSNWSVTSGTLPFTLFPNNAILDPSYKRYFQARVELHTTVSGQSPILQGIGIESGFKLTISGGMSEPVYAKSSNFENNTGNDASLICWTFEDRTI